VLPSSVNSAVLAVHEPTFRRNISPLVAGAGTRWDLSLLIFDPENGGDTFLRNVGLHTDYKALYPKRWQHR
jgi:hypothetical protein